MNKETRQFIYGILLVALGGNGVTASIKLLSDEHYLFGVAVFGIGVSLATLGVRYINKTV